jgi:hypothetical protein
MENRCDLISECQQPFSPHKNRVVVEVIVLSPMGCVNCLPMVPSAQGTRGFGRDGW